MKIMLRWIAAIAAALMLTGIAHAAADPFLGTWRLDKTRSTIANDPGVKSKEFVFTPTADGVMIDETLEMNSGEKHVSHLPYAYGKPTPQAGPGFDTLLVEKSDANHATWTVSGKGQLLSRLEVVVSPDGSEMAFRYLSSAGDPTGAVTKDRYVYVRQ
jgi:hypothetical protein